MVSMHVFFACAGKPLFLERMCGCECVCSGSRKYVWRVSSFVTCRGMWERYFDLLMCSLDNCVHEDTFTKLEVTVGGGLSGATRWNRQDLLWRHFDVILTLTYTPTITGTTRTELNWTRHGKSWRVVKCKNNSGRVKLDNTHSHDVLKILDVSTYVEYICTSYVCIPYL